VEPFSGSWLEPVPGHSSLAADSKKTLTDFSVITNGGTVLPPREIQGEKLFKHKVQFMRV